MSLLWRISDNVVSTIILPYCEAFEHRYSSPLGDDNTHITISVENHARYRLLHANDYILPDE